jgi:hypothetical protein
VYNKLRNAVELKAYLRAQEETRQQKQAAAARACPKGDKLLSEDVKVAAAAAKEVAAATLGAATAAAQQLASKDGTLAACLEMLEKTEDEDVMQEGSDAVWNIAGSAHAESLPERQAACLSNGGPATMARVLLKSARPVVHVNATNALTSMTFNNPEGKAACLTANVVESLVDMVGKSSHDGANEAACCLLNNLANSDEGRSVCIYYCVPDCMIDLIDKSSNDGVLKFACKALVNITANSAKGQAACVASGVPAALVTVLGKSSNDEVMRLACSVLLNTAFRSGLLVSRDNALALLNNSEAMAHLDRINALDMEACKPWLNNCILALRNI